MCPVVVSKEEYDRKFREYLKQNEPVADQLSAWYYRLRAEFRSKWDK